MSYGWSLGNFAFYGRLLDHKTRYHVLTVALVLFSIASDIGFMHILSLIYFSGLRNFKFLEW